MESMIETIEHSDTEAPNSDSPFNTVMKTWARWMKLDDKPHPTGDANPQDVKEFMACAEAVDAMVNDLPLAQRWAIRKAFGVTTVWRFPDITLESAFSEAEARLTPRLLKNVATRRYFH